VADARGAAEAVLRGHFDEAVNPPDLLDDFKGAVVFDRQTGGIISTVFKAFQSFQEDG
jgi:hypothetical protein